MAILSLRMIGDPVLRSPAEPVGESDAHIHRLVADMYQTMDAAGGIGLAAPQIGVGLRVFTYDVPVSSGRSRGAVINPELELSGERDFVAHHASQPAEGENLVREGCLSVAEIHGPVQRDQQVRLRGRAPDGEDLDLHASGLLAACFQHEVDHLDGRLFIDRLRGAEKREALRTLRERDYQTALARTSAARGMGDHQGEAAGSSFFGGPRSGWGEAVSGGTGSRRGAQRP